MIRALIGRAILHCIHQAHTRPWRATVVTRLHPGEMNDAQISDLIHGRPIRPARVRPIPISTTVPRART
jgi:hypothetical protein